jgi:proline dehydrogenase
MIRSALHRLAMNRPLGAALTPVVERFIGGASVAEAIKVAADVSQHGYRVSLERATGMHEGVAADVIPDLEDMAAALARADLRQRSELVIFPHSLHGVSESTVDDLCRRILDQGIDVMFGMGPSEAIEPTLAHVRRLRDEGLEIGVTLQAALRRTQHDCEQFSDGLVRLVKGAYHVSGGAVFTSSIEVDKSYVRCARVLLAERSAVSFATHDPRLLDILITLVDRSAHDEDAVEFAFYLGRHERDQRRLLESGHPVRIYIPFGPQWFERLVDGLAEQPGGLISALQSLVP